MKQEDSSINLQLLEPGTIIYYKLAPEQHPSDPDKLWKGKILYRFHEGYRVECLESGHEGQENVYYRQVAGVEL